MALVTCPTCGKSFESTASRTMPFCCDRCRKIDLGRWLNEDITLPFRELPDDDSRPPRDVEPD